jgi:outer membrane protein assembly factor BamA
MSKTSQLFKLGIALLLLPMQLHAQVAALDRGMSLDEKRDGWIPYLFATDSLGTTVGVAGFSAGNFQPQSSFFATAFVTSNDSALVSASLNNIRLGGSRWMVDTFILADHFTDQRFYVDYDRDPDEVRAGSNDSDKDDYATGISDERSINIGFKYRLPIGGIKDDPVAVYRVHVGMLESGPTGGGPWNPKTSGQTTLGTRFFFTDRDLRNFSIGPDRDRVVNDVIAGRTTGLDFWLEYDNTDFPRNASRGSRQLVTISRDFGLMNSSNTWTNIQVDLSKYYDLGSSSWFRQKVLALNFWTSSSPTWDTDPLNPSIVKNRPPPRRGSTLGGFDRLRGYPSGRFNDKAAVYYAAELRLTPQTRPLRNLAFLNYFEIDWWQVVPFVELGRVGPKYNSELFFEDLKWSAGIGLRVMAFRTPVRLDIARSAEGTSVWAMVSQPFSRQGQ